MPDNYNGYLSGLDDSQNKRANLRAFNSIPKGTPVIEQGEKDKPDD
jgi:hypothetical protein